MEYQRIENFTAYKIITTVDDDGNYAQFTLWDDGTIYGFYKSTLQEMGWKSVRAFLRERRNFNKVIGNSHDNLVSSIRKEHPTC